MKVGSAAWLFLLPTMILLCADVLSGAASGEIDHTLTGCGGGAVHDCLIADNMDVDVEFQLSSHFGRMVREGGDPPVTQPTRSPYKAAVQPCTDQRNYLGCLPQPDGYDFF